MGGDDYVIDENGAWGNQSTALEWYRAEVKRLRAAIQDALESPHGDAEKTILLAALKTPNTRS